MTTTRPEIKRKVKRKLGFGNLKGVTNRKRSPQEINEQVTREKEKIDIGAFASNKAAIIACISAISQLTWPGQKKEILDKFIELGDLLEKVLKNKESITVSKTDCPLLAISAMIREDNQVLPTTYPNNCSEMYSVLTDLDSKLGDEIASQSGYSNLSYLKQISAKVATAFTLYNDHFSDPDGAIEFDKGYTESVRSEMLDILKQRAAQVETQDNTTESLIAKMNSELKRGLAITQLYDIAQIQQKQLKDIQESNKSNSVKEKEKAKLAENMQELTSIKSFFTENTMQLKIGGILSSGDDRSKRIIARYYEMIILNLVKRAQYLAGMPYNVVFTYKQFSGMLARFDNLVTLIQDSKRPILLDEEIGRDFMNIVASDGSGELIEWYMGKIGEIDKDAMVRVLQSMSDKDYVECVSKVQGYREASFVDGTKNRLKSIYEKIANRGGSRYTSLCGFVGAVFAFVPTTCPPRCLVEVGTHNFSLRPLSHLR